MTRGRPRISWCPGRGAARSGAPQTRDRGGARPRISSAPPRATRSVVHSIRGTACAMAFSLIAVALSSARADDYPSRPITLVVPFPAGGTNTIMARIVADKLADALGQQLIVDNRGGGAGGTIGTRQVARAEPDGYTILLAFTSTLSTAPSMYANLGYDVRKDFAPIGLISSSPSVLSVHPGLPARSVAELIALLKANAEPFQYGSPGVGSVKHPAAGVFFPMGGGGVTPHSPKRRG